MPIAVTCPACSVGFSVKDEYAGKRSECPECAAPLTVPGGTDPVKVPPPVAKPVVASRPKPPAGDADEPPRSKRRREDDPDADAPRSRRRRRDEDDEPKKKSKALPIVLGVLGGLVLVCGGGCAGVWFLWIKPAADKLEALASSRMTMLDAGKPPAVRPAEEPPMFTGGINDFLNKADDDRKRHEKQWVQLTGPVPQVHINTYANKPADGWVLLGVPGGNVLTCYFGPDEWDRKPKFDDEKEYTVLGLYEMRGGSPALSWCRVTSAAEREPATKVNMANLLANTIAYQGRMVEVEGSVQSATLRGASTQVVLTTGGQAKGVRFELPPNQKGTIAVADKLTVKGKVEQERDGFVDLSFRKIVSRTASGNPPPQPAPTDPNGPVVTTDADMVQAFIKEITSPDQQYAGKQVKLTGKVVDVKDDNVFFGGTEANGFAHYVEVRMVGRGARPKKGDAVTVVGKYHSYETRLTNGTRTIILTEGKVDRGGEGKDPPAPPADAIKVKADGLAAEFAKDADAARKKYADKTLTVSGTVERTFPTGSRITLKGVAADGSKKAFVVDVTVLSTLRDEAKKVKAGDTVTLTGKYFGFRSASGANPNTVQLTNGTINK